MSLVLSFNVSSSDPNMRADYLDYPYTTSTSIMVETTSYILTNEKSDLIEYSEEVSFVYQSP